MADIAGLWIIHRNTAKVTASSFAERNAALGRVGDNPRREVALDQCCNQFRFGVSAQLEQRFDDGRNERNTAVLVRAFRFHDVQDLG